MRYCFVLFFFTIAHLSSAQKRQELFDFFFKPNTGGSYYFVTTEKKDSGWYQEAWYSSQKTLAQTAWYKDEAAKVLHGPFINYHPNRKLKSHGLYRNGQREGTRLTYNEKGMMTDSVTYRNDRLVGISLGWHENGYLRDSTHVDESGNGVQVSWYDEGSLASAGRLTADEKKYGRWKYYHKNGAVLATEEYTAGKLTACLCYDEAGLALDTALCSGKEAEPNGGLRGWQRFLERSLLYMLQQKEASKQWTPGVLTVVVRFVVEKDGSLNEFTPLTAYGKGVEDGVIAFMKKAPKWTPGRQWGRPVRSYHTQPVTFMIQ